MNTTTDQFGICCVQNAGFSALGSLGVSPLTYDENYAPSYTGVTEKFIDACKKIMKTFHDPDYCATNATPGYSTMDCNQVFAAGRGLFYVQVSGALKLLRDSTVDYGIVTLPKYDTNQEKYMSTISPTGCSCAAIIANNPDPSRTGTVLENIAAYSHKLMLPAYYDITLCYKYSKDQTSIEMLDTVFQNGYLEVAFVYNFGSIRNTVQNLLIARSENIASSLEAIGNIVKKQLDAVVSKLVD
ncbi:MAG: hypothetical protein GX057_07160 [Clostridiales bacterium]|nr:hypothetical protein [Clostridiales bacterium]